MTTHPAGTRRHLVTDSPIGPLTLVAAEHRLAGVYMRSTRHDPPPTAIGVAARAGDDDVLDAAAGQLAEYFAGSRTQFDLPVELDGTQFQRTVWQTLRSIPYGATISYGELAGRIGQPSASRAVGLANGRNPVSIVVPCHRVIGANGSLTGYGGGIERKRFLLALEQRVSGSTLI
ncbi:MAG: methylated-DNA--[protein]-cysteine S-methyltransferase [Actinomycetota bacterium]|jgi:methylated-DNA-[protein]-cysteine S-methyltransferase|nr:methylated-DNA--[protein]-cysteine S-methyltransferase [Actinomycetota bacterium]